MPLLDRTGLRADPWRRLTADEIAGVARPLVAWDAAPHALARATREQRIGVEIDATVRASDLRLVQDSLALVAIRFPAYGDGRGFSIARQLRNNGYQGTLRAVGPLIADQFSFALACGFDEVETTDDILLRQPAGHWLCALGAIANTYQRGYGDAGNILDQRRAARRAKGDA